MSKDGRSRKRRRPGLQDIASRVGTTKMTVSRCLRKPDSVSQPLRTRILETAAEIGYLPNHAPSMMLGAGSLSLGMLVPSVTNQVFSDVLAGVVDETEKVGYRLMVSHYGYDPAAEERGLMSLIAANVDGLILSDRTHTDATLRMIENSGLPVVEVMDTRTPALQQAVGYDNHAASREMVEEIISAGYQRIVYLAVRLDERTMQRQDGYAAAMRAAGHTPVSLHSAQKSSFSVGASLMARIFDEYPGTDAIFCTNDDVAVGAYFECLRRGVSVPADMAIAGFHGLDVGQAMVPRLASVRTPRHEIGAVAARVLLARINGEPIEAIMHDLGYQITLGQTIAARSD